MAHQVPWSLEVSGTTPATWTADVSEQLVVLNCVMAQTHAPVESSIDHPAHAAFSEGKLLLTASVTPAAYDTSYDGYGACSPPIILCSFGLHGCAANPKSVKLSIRPGSKVALSIVPTAPMSAELLTHLRVTCSGILLTGLPGHSGWRPVLRGKWFTVKSTVQKTTVRDAPPHILSPHLRSGAVGEAVAISTCSNLIMWSNRVQSLLSEVQPYSKVFTPARPDKIVRIRRFPHRHADVIGIAEFGVQKRAIGQVIDETENELYVQWEDGGWSRVVGSGGQFLIEHRLQACVVFDVPKLYTSSREGRGVRVRNEPNLTAKQIGSMEANEVREAVALHSDDQGNQFVEWKSGGFSCVGGLHGSFLLEMTPVSQSLRGTVLRATRGPPSPEIVSLNRRMKRPRSPSGTDSEDELAHMNSKKHPYPEDSGISPGLVPQTLRHGVASGKVKLSELPEMQMEVGSENSDFDDSDEVDWSDEEAYSTDDFDEDAEEDE